MSLDFLRHLLDGQNQFASGGLLLMAIGGIIASLKSIPSKLLEAMKNQATIKITVKSEDAAFKWVRSWLVAQKFVQKTRRADLVSQWKNKQDTMSIMLSPGRHWFWYKGRPFTVDFHRSEKAEGYDNKRTEEFTFRTLGRNQEILKRFVSEVMELLKANTKKTPKLYVFNRGWNELSAFVPRVLDSVILDENYKEKLVADVEQFRKAEDHYTYLGVPYHRGYLLYGPPGTGKSSLVSAISGHFGMSVYALNLGSLSDDTLRESMQEIEAGSIILFEDIDAMKAATERAAPHKEEQDEDVPATGTEKSNDLALLRGVTLSGLLNVLDGFYAPSNVIYMMTTNHVEKLDPALLRPGRIDYKLHLHNASFEQKKKLYQRFFPDDTPVEVEAFIHNNDVLTMADFQGCLLEKRNASQT